MTRSNEDDDGPPFPPLIRQATQWILEHTIGIYFKMPGGNPVPWGTGVLLRIADASFVLSASHVLERASEAVTRLSACVDGARFVTVSSVDLRRSADVDLLDVGILRLSDENARSLSIHKKFLRMCDLDTAAQMPEGAYLVAGYPAQLTQIDHGLNEIRAHYFSYLTGLVEVDRGTPGITLGLAFEQGVLRNGNGTLMSRMPDLKGISGCGIWRVWLESQSAELGKWHPSWIRLSGIEHAVTPRSSIRGTTIGHVLQMIARSYPELIPPMRVSLQ